VRSTSSFPLLLSALLTIAVAPAFAQRTVTKDAGNGRKIVLHYNAADQITETDTLGPNGELIERDALEYRPNAYIPQTFNTLYWPNGKPHRVTRNTYDDNSNFTGEFIQIYDESGKQIGGHRLVHDPLPNTYHCEDWNAAAQSYQAVECPAGEEAKGAPETVKQFTQQEVEQQVARARKNAATPPPPANPGPATTGGTAVKEVGLVLPSHIRPGERVSGSVVENPADYENMPQVTVTRVSLPFEAAGTLSSLAGWSVLISGEQPQPADGPISVTIPPGQVELAILFHPAGNVGAPVSKAIPLPHQTRDKNRGASVWEAPATCVKRNLCMVHGLFTGNSSKTFATFGDQPARIIAETTTAAYLAIPDATDAGPRPLVIVEAGKAIAFPMVVSVVGIRPDRRALNAGDKLLIYVTVDGPEELPDQEWHPGNFPPSNLDEARALVPGYQPAHAGKNDHEAHEAEERREKAEKAAKNAGANGAPQAGEKFEPEPEQPGELLLVVKATTSDALTFRGSTNGTYVFRLHNTAFKMGEYKYKFVVDAAKAGKFDVRWNMVPMLAPMPGQEFTLAPEAAK
jgi:hypothetical protein